MKRFSVSPGCEPDVDELLGKIRELEDQVAELQDEVSDLEKDLKYAREEIRDKSRALKTIEELSEQINDLARREK